MHRQDGCAGDWGTGAPHSSSAVQHSLATCPSLHVWATVCGHTCHHHMPQGACRPGPSQYACTRLIHSHGYQLQSPRNTVPLCTLPSSLSFLLYMPACLSISLPPAGWLAGRPADLMHYAIPLAHLLPPLDWEIMLSARSAAAFKGPQLALACQECQECQDGSVLSIVGALASQASLPAGGWVAVL